MITIYPSKLGKETWEWVLLNSWIMEELCLFESVDGWFILG